METTTIRSSLVEGTSDRRASAEQARKSSAAYDTKRILGLNVRKKKSKLGLGLGSCRGYIQIRKQISAFLCMVLLLLFSAGIGPTPTKMKAAAAPAPFSRRGGNTPYLRSGDEWIDTKTHTSAMFLTLSANSGLTDDATD